MLYSKEDMVKIPGTFICAVALMINAFGIVYQDLQVMQHRQEMQRKLIISCAKNSYTVSIKVAGPPRNTRNGNPARHNDQSGCVHSGSAAVETSPQRLKRLYGKGNACSH